MGNRCRARLPQRLFQTRFCCCHFIYQDRFRGLEDYSVLIGGAACDPWMSELLRGIEWGCVGALLVPPFQGREVYSAHDLGLGAVRLTPGCHIAGFQPAGQRALCTCHRFEARLARPFRTF